MATTAPRDHSTSLSVVAPTPVSHFDAGQILAALINQLPAEILIEIIYSFCSTNVLRVGDVTDEPEYLHCGLSGHWHRNLRLLSSVCHRWKDTIDCSPRLWAFVYAGDPIDVVKKALEKSGHHPLIVQDQVPQHPSSAPDEFYNMATEHLKRCSFVRLVVRPGFNLAVLQNAAPELRHCDLWAPVNRDARFDATPVNLLAGNAEALETVNLWGVDAAWDSPVFTGLRHLTIGYVDVSIVQVLAFLVRCPRLKILKLQVLQGPKRLYGGPPILLDELTKVSANLLEGEQFLGLISGIIAPRCNYLEVSLEGEVATTGQFGCRLLTAFPRAFPNVMSDVVRTQLQFGGDALHFKAFEKTDSERLNMELPCQSRMHETVLQLSELAGDSPMTAIITSMNFLEEYIAEELLALRPVTNLIIQAQFDLEPFLERLGGPVNIQSGVPTWGLPNLRRIEFLYSLPPITFANVLKKRYKIDCGVPPPAWLEALSVVAFDQKDEEVKTAINEVLGSGVFCWRDPSAFEIQCWKSIQRWNTL